MHNSAAPLFLFLIATFFSGCSIDEFVPAYQKPRYLIESRQDWRIEIVNAVHFRLLAAVSPVRQKNDVLTIYIEGDGRAWSMGKLSPDPTPSDPVALRLALAHPKASNVVYLARPCQYQIRKGAICDPRLWSSHRYAEDVVLAYDFIINMMKARYQATMIQLVGYSGGGALAVLIAAEREDISRIVTVAANLDIAAWTKMDNLTPLYGSLNPADFARAVAHIPQFHFAGADDNVVRPEALQSYTRRLPPNSGAEIKIIERYDHDCCWVDAWPNLARTADLQ